ncbi:hypothetical protein ACOMHN_028270 [Nucella lapillus]
MKATAEATVAMKATAEATVAMKATAEATVAMGEDLQGETCSGVAVCYVVCGAVRGKGMELISKESLCIMTMRKGDLSAVLLSCYGMSEPTLYPLNG